MLVEADRTPVLHRKLAQLHRDVVIKKRSWLLSKYNDMTVTKEPETVKLWLPVLAVTLKTPKRHT